MSAKNNFSFKNLILLIVIFRTTEYLLPMFLELLKDENPEVRLNIISKLEVVNKGKLQIQNIAIATVILTHFSRWYRITFTIFIACNCYTC